MLRFNYYIIDVGENYCYIYQKSFVFSLVNAIREKNDIRLRLVKEVILHDFKKKAPIFSEQEFKVVYVNKQDKISIKTYLEDEDHTRYEPLISTKKYDVYIVNPKQRVNIECQVVKNETEIRSLAYKYIVSRPKKRR